MYGRHHAHYRYSYGMHFGKHVELNMYSRLTMPFLASALIVTSSLFWKKLSPIELIFLSVWLNIVVYGV